MFNENTIRNVSFGLNEVKFMDGKLSVERADTILRNLMELYREGLISRPEFKTETGKVYKVLLEWDSPLRS